MKKRRNRFCQWPVPFKSALFGTDYRPCGQRHPKGQEYCEKHQEFHDRQMAAAQRRLKQRNL